MDKRDNKSGFSLSAGAFLRRFATVALVVAVGIGSAACSKQKTIPNSTLSDIFCDMFLVNGYCATDNLQTDSLDLYTPVLEKYGYERKDFVYTLGSFSKRKSAKLSDVIESAVEKLEKQTALLEGQVRNLEYVDSVATYRLRTLDYAREKIAINSFNDTARLRINLPVKEGRYELAFNYTVDTLDLNRRLQGFVRMYSRGGSRVMNTRLQITTGGEKNNYTTEFRTTAKDSVLQLLFVDYESMEERPYVTIDSVRLLYYPPTKDALALMDSTLMYKKDYTTDYATTQNSDTLPLRRPYVIALPDSVDSLRRDYNRPKPRQFSDWY